MLNALRNIVVGKPAPRPGINPDHSQVLLLAVLDMNNRADSEKERQILELLDDGALIDTPLRGGFVFDDGRTLLSHYAQKENLAMVKELLARGADPNRLDDRGESALSAGHNPEIARLLVAAGADVNHRSKDDRSVLCYAMTEKGNHLNLATLIDLGADFVHFHKDGPALDYAYMIGCSWALEVLVKSGAYIHPGNCDDNAWLATQRSVAKKVYQLWKAESDKPHWLDHGRAIRLGNLGKLHEALHPAHWQGHEEALRALCVNLPPALLQDMLAKQPALMASLSHPTPVIEGWGIEMAGVVSMGQERGHG